MSNVTPPPRPYTQRKRRQSAEETRQRIVEAAQELLSTTGYPHVTLDDIAAAAGVSRQTVYVQLGSKSGVLQAVAEHIEQASLDGLLAVLFQAATPLEGLRYALQRVAHFYDHYGDVLRTLHAQTVYDAVFAAMWQAKQHEIWGNTRRLVQWLEGERLLTREWSVDEATDLVWALSSFDSYVHLVGERGWSQEQFVVRTLQTIERTLVADEG